MNKIIARPIAWNKLRYKQIYNHELSSELLFEEFEEWKAAETEVDKLDALVDMYFVSIGVLWKMNYPTEQYLQDYSHVTYNKTIIDVLVSFMSYLTMSTRASAITHLIYNLLFEMQNMGLTKKQVRQAILIVCDSNDSKIVEKTPSYVKANIVKGASFISPEPRLQLLLQEVFNGK